jgi:hypothetical protein
MRSAACALLVTLLLVACGTGQPVRRTWFASTCGQPPLLQHPTEISISCDGNVVLQHLRWSNWGTGTASGTGSIDIGGGCVPNCAQQPVYTYPVTIRVNEIATCPDNRRVYGLLVATITKGTDFRGQRTFSDRLVACV